MIYDLVAPDPSPQNERVDARSAASSAASFGPVCDATWSPLRRFASANRRDFPAGKQALKVGGRGRYKCSFSSRTTATRRWPMCSSRTSSHPATRWTGATFAPTRNCSTTSTTQETDAKGTTVVWHLPSVESPNASTSRTTSRARATSTPTSSTPSTVRSSATKSKTMKHPPRRLPRSKKPRTRRRLPR